MLQERKPKISKRQKLIFVISLILFLILLILFGWQTLNPKSIIAPGESVAQILDQSAQPNSTPFPFQELTIPYLRSREYNSKLGELQQALETSSYTGYLTSYDSDGLKINGLLTIPKGDVPKNGFPAVVFLHGYIPPQSYKTLENYNSYVDYFAKRGMVVFKIDLRGHDQSQGDASSAYYSSDYVIDTLNAYSSLENAEFIDTNKIGLWGHSMAGNVVLRAMVANPTIPKVVIWAGAVYTYTDLAEFGINDDSYRPPATDSPRRRKRQELMDTYGQFDSTSWFWQQVPATNYLNGIRGAVQIHHVTNDAVVNVGYSRNLVEILESAGIKSELFEYSSGGHNISGSVFLQAMQRSVEFYLK